MNIVLVFFALLLSCFTVLRTPVSAKYDPGSVPNNKYGVHIADPNDIGEVASLVNSGGGDWGYVTLVIQEDNRNRDKWQRVFDIMRKDRLIPIVRIATHITGDSWAKPYADAHTDWARFLNELNWPIENRYVVIYNEPNHANEWAKSLDPEDYARTFVRHAKALRESNEDFFILPAGLDVSAASDGKSLDAAVYLRRMVNTEPGIFDYMDGWTSHSYPNPGFSGSPYGTGRGTLRSYQWELSQLKQHGLTKDLPVFITETGWVHRSGVGVLANLLSPERVGENLKIASQSVWQDKSIVAITPFVFSYQGLPFDHFSWKKLGSSDFYPHYFSYQEIQKSAGIPFQREKYTLDKNLIPESLVAGSVYTVSALVKNEGQGILTHRDGRYSIELVTAEPFTIIMDPLPDMEPGQFGTLTVHIITPNEPGETYDYALDVVTENQRITLETGTIAIVPPPGIDLSVQLGWRKDNDVDSATVLVYNHHTLLHKVEGVVFRNGTAQIDNLHNIIPGETYRVVVLVPYYLPRQKITQLFKETTVVAVPRMYPLDFDLDGRLNPGDLISAIRLPPNFVASLFSGR